MPYRRTNPAARKWPMRIFIIIALALVTLVVVIVLLPLNLLRSPLASWASQRLERNVTLAGNLTMQWTWPPRLDMAELTVANPPGFPGDFLTVERASVTFAPFSLLTPSPRLALVELVEPRLALARHADGTRNWVLGSTATANTNAAAPEVHVGLIRIVRGLIDVDDALLGAKIRGAAWTEGNGVDSALHFGGDGTYAGQAVAIGGRGDGLNALRAVDTPYRLTFAATAGATRVAFAGDVVPAQPENLNGTLSIKGQDASLLYPMVPVPIPWTPPYQLSGKLTHARGVWRYQDFAGTVGASDLRGVIAIDINQPRRAVDADLRSRRFDYADLGGFVGLPPGRPGHQSSAPDQRVERAERARSPRLLPATEYPLAELRAFDARVRFRGEHVRFADLPFDSLDAKLDLKDGVLQVDPLVTTVGKGDMTLRLTMDTNGPVARSESRLKLRNVDLKELFPALASPKGSAGNVNGYTNIRSTGNSIAAMLASADGKGALVMRGGEASTLAVVLVNLDLARASLLLLSGDKPSSLRCAVTAFEVKDGKLDPSIFVVDTSAATIEGDGEVDFAGERYDLTLTAKSKTPSLFALHGPILVSGTFKQPMVAPAPLPIAARVGLAVGLAAVAPPLALLPFVDLGLADDVDCHALMAGRSAQVALHGAAAARN